MVLTRRFLESKYEKIQSSNIKERDEMKKIILTVLVGMTLVSSSVEASSSFMKSVSKYINIVGQGISNTMSLLDSDNIPDEVIKIGAEIVAGHSAIPLSVYGASSLGVTASTGTAIATLSGVAATNATLYAIGSGAASVIAGVTGVAIAPAVVGGAIVTGIATSVIHFILNLF